jgi:hypothetical protein
MYEHRRAEEAGEPSREFMVTPAHEKWYEEHPDREGINEMMKKWDDYHNGVIDYARDAGMYTPELAEEFKNSDYAPLQKSFTDLKEIGENGLVEHFKGTGRSASRTPSLKHSEQMVNMAENMKRSHYKVIVSAMRNQAKRTAIKQLGQLDESLVRPISKNRVANLSASEKAKLMSYWDNGKERYAIIEDPQLLQSLAFIPPQAHAAFDMLNKFGSGLIRTSTVQTPVFFLKQLPLEMFHAITLSGTGHGGISGIPNLIKNISTSMVGKNNAAEVLARSGQAIGPHDFVDMMDKSYDEIHAKQNWIKKVPVVGKPLEGAFKKLGQAGAAADAGVRAHIYEMAKKDGEKHLGLSGEQLEAYAINKARQFINFSNKGSSEAANSLRNLYLFTGAAINGVDSMMRNLSGYGMGPKEAAIARKASITRAMVTGAALTGWYFYQMQTNPELYKNMDDAEKDTALLLGKNASKGLAKLLGEPEDSTIAKINLPWEAGWLMNTMPRLVTMGLINALGFEAGIPPGQAAKRLYAASQKMIMPPLPVEVTEKGSIRLNAPSAVAPIVEAGFNYDPRTGASIDSPSDLKRLPEERTRGVSSTGKWFAEMINSVSPHKVSPRVVDHILRGYFGEYHGLANAFAERREQENAMKTGDTSGVMPKSPTQEYPFLRNYMVNPNKTARLNEAYDYIRETSQVAQMKRDAQKSGKKDAVEKLKKDPEYQIKEGYSKGFNDLNQQLTQINSDLAAVEYSKMPMGQKKVVQRKLLDARQILADKAVEIGKKMEKAIEDASLKRP